MSLSEQCSPDTRPVENRRTMAPVTTRSEEDKGEVCGFDQVTSQEFNDGKWAGEEEEVGRVQKAGCRRMDLSSSSSLRVGHR